MDIRARLYLLYVQLENQLFNLELWLHSFDSDTYVTREATQTFYEALEATVGRLDTGWSQEPSVVNIEASLKADDQSSMSPLQRQELIGRVKALRNFLGDYIYNHLAIYFAT